MTPDEYRAALKELGLTQNQASKLFGVNAVTARKWAANKPRVTKSGDHVPPGPPTPVAKHLELLLILKRLLP